MGKLTTQLEETPYTFSGDDEEMRFVADEDDGGAMWQQVSTEEPSVCTRILWSDLSIKILSQDSGGGGVGSLLISAR